MLEAAIWAENIPFNETRDYVKKVLANTTGYAALITGQPQSLKARLGQVGPRNAPLSNADEEPPPDCTFPTAKDRPCSPSTSATRTTRLGPCGLGC